MKITQVKVGSLKTAEYNPRKWPQEAIDNLKKSISEFGLVDPIIVNSAPERKNIIIGGHFRLFVAKELGYEEVPVIYLDISDIKKEKELNLRLNKNLGDWDYQILKEFDRNMLIDVGFNTEEIDKIYIEKIEEDNFDADEEYKKIAKPKAKSGDLYQLGSHRLLCGDSTKKEDFEKLMNKEKAQLVFTDPPFNVGYNYWGFRKTENFRKKQKGKAWGKELFNDKKSPAEYQEFIRQFTQNCLDFSEDSASIYCYYASKQETLVRGGMEQASWYISQTLIWLKPSLIISPGQDYHRIYEPCYFGWKKGKKHFVNKKYTGKFVEAQMLDYEKFEEMLDILYERRDTATSKYIHPTQKPVRLSERAIKKHSKIQDIILEPFNGSGSTMIAAEQMGRKCYSMELDPKFVDVAIKRWEQFTGKRSIKIN